MRSIIWAILFLGIGAMLYGLSGTASKPIAPSTQIETGPEPTVAITSDGSKISQTEAQPSAPPETESAQPEQVKPLPKERPSETLVTISPTCVFGAWPFSDSCKPVWKRLEAEDGEVTWIDMHAIGHSLAPATVVAYTSSVPDAALSISDIYNFKTLQFDCGGHFSELPDGSGYWPPWTDAPPRSVAGEIAAIACKNR